MAFEPANARHRWPLLWMLVAVLCIPPGAGLAAQPDAARGGRLRDAIEALLERGELPAESELLRFRRPDGALLPGRVFGRRRRGERDYSVHGRLGDGGRFRIVRVGTALVGNLHPRGGPPLELRMDPATGRPVLREPVDHPGVRCGLEAMPVPRRPGPSRRFAGLPEPAERAVRRPSARTDTTGVAVDGGGVVATDGGPDGAWAVADNGVYVDVLIVYTAAARIAAGGEDAIRAVAHLSIDTTNEAYGLSGIRHRLRLAGVREVAYSEAGATQLDHLERLRRTADGYMDEAMQWRDDYGADIVSLLVDDVDGGGGSFTFGIAYIVGGPSEGPYAVNVSDQAYAASANNWTFAHEVGHNLGAAHDLGDPYNAILPFAIGRQFSGNTEGLVQTIMARRSLGGTRIQRFTNPSVFYDGQPLGITGLADLWAGFDISDDTVQDYRAALPESVYVDFAASGPQDGTEARPFDSLAAAAQAVRWGGTIVLLGGSTTDGAIGALTVDRPFRIIAQGGAVTLD